MRFPTLCFGFVGLQSIVEKSQKKLREGFDPGKCEGFNRNEYEGGGKDDECEGFNANEGEGYDRPASISTPRDGKRP